MSKTDKRILTLSFWIFILIIVFYLYFFQADYVREKFTILFELPLAVGGSIYFLLGCVRGFTLIPSTVLILFGIVFIPAWPLYFLTLAGIMVSSLIVYYFSEYLNLDEFFEEKHGKSLLKLKNSLEKRELPIVILWSMAPFLPTDAVCYVCGALEVSVRKMLLGVFIGESVICFFYIFLGQNIFSFLSANLI